MRSLSHPVDMIIFDLNDLSSDFDLHEYRHYYLAENWKISKRVRKTHQLSPGKYLGFDRDSFLTGRF